MSSQMVSSLIWTDVAFILFATLAVHRMGDSLFFLSVLHRSMKRARDVRDQLEGLMERVEIELTSNPHDNTAIRKVVKGVRSCMYLMAG